jgi:hypothetical protein
MYKNATKCNKTLSKWCKNKHGASKIIDTFETYHQQSLRNYHNSWVHPQSFVVGDLVLRLKQYGHGKLESPWVGPYIMTEVIPGGAYRLQDKKAGKDESNPWNAE